jgi:uncharacterized protein YdeI (YjbR/CyaY-like superfamily)
VGPSLKPTKHCKIAPGQDFIKALQKNKRAEKFFTTLSRPNTYSVVFRLQTAKNEEMRKMKIEKMIKMFERGEKFH